MNHWTKLSIEYAEQKSYLDDLFQVYPTIPDGIRELDKDKWKTCDNYNRAAPHRDKRTRRHGQGTA
jgi:hypothetical protein